MLSTNKFNHYILFSLTAHILCASFLLLQKDKLQQVDADIQEIVNIVLHPATKNFTAPVVNVPAKTKNETTSLEKETTSIVEKTTTALMATQSSGEAGQIGRAAKNSEEKYIAELKYDLEKRKKYPLMAKKMGHTGRVTIKFEINRSGEIIHSEIMEHSSYASLNESVQKLLLETKNFKPLPDEIQRTTWKFILPVEFKL